MSTTMMVVSSFKPTATGLGSDGQKKQGGGAGTRRSRRIEECVGRGRPPLSTIDDAITCQRVIEAVERSIAESRHVAV